MSSGCWGYDEQEFVGLPFRHLFQHDEQEAALDEMETATRTGRSDDERWHVRKDGVSSGSRAS